MRERRVAFCAWQKSKRRKKPVQVACTVQVPGGGEGASQNLRFAGAFGVIEASCTVASPPRIPRHLLSLCVVTRNSGLGQAHATVHGGRLVTNNTAKKRK